MDAIDAALVDFAIQPPRLIATQQLEIPADVRAPLEQVIRNGNISLEQLGQLDHQLGKLFSQTVQQLLLQTEGIEASQIKAIGSHGQTIFHQPQAPHPFSMQIGDANLIAEQTGITTVADFRRRDMAAGGQGAPLVPAFHEALFRSSSVDRVVLNIGGIANISILPSDNNIPVSGFDTGPGNTLMDSWIQQHRNMPMDRDGEWAANGTIHKKLLESLLSDPYFSLQAPKSTGREYFNLAWLAQYLTETIHPEDVQATLCELSAVSISRAIQSQAIATMEVLVCGGGSNNSTLMSRLQYHLGKCSLTTTDSHGVAPQWVEAMAFAWLAKQTCEEKAGNLPAVTGASHPVILGGIYIASEKTSSRN